MTNETLRGMAHAYDFCEWSARERKLKTALLWLADNVSDEMVFAAIAPDEPNMVHFKKAFRGAIEGARTEISRALRAAAEGK